MATTVKIKNGSFLLSNDTPDEENQEKKNIALEFYQREKTGIDDSVAKMLKKKIQNSRLGTQKLCDHEHFAQASKLAASS